MDEELSAGGMPNNVESRLKRLDAIDEAQVVLASETEPDAILGALVEHAAGIINAETIAVTLLSGDRKNVRYAFAHGKHSETLKSAVLPLSSAGLCGWVLENKKPILSVNLLEDPRVLTEFAVSLGIHTALLTPLLAKGEIIGGVSAFNKEDGSKFDEDDLSALSQLSGYAALAVANARAEKQIDAQRSEFISMLSHDLKTPLASIKGYSDMIDQEDDMGEIRKLNRVVAANAERMLRLINEILEYARVESGRLSMDRTAVAMKPFFGMAMTQFAPIAKERGVTIAWHAAEDMREAYADLDLLTRILANLVTNALEHARPGGNVWVSASNGPEGSVMVEVEDDGPGIRPDYLPRIFDKYFSRGKGSYGGSGLGLFIVRALCEMHGGSVTVESEHGRGARFTVALPAAGDGPTAA